MNVHHVPPRSDRGVEPASFDSDRASPPTHARVSRRQLLAACIAAPLVAVLAGCAPDSGRGSSGTNSRRPSLTVSPSGGQSGRAGTLVVYFSRAGENYWYGGRRDLRVGNTRRLVDMIASRIDCDTYEIVPADPYPRAYEPTVDRNVREIRADARPAIADPLPDVARYRHVLIGSPVWASQAPMIMSTFVEGVDLGGTRVLPFVTFAVSGMSGVDEHYRSVLPTARVVDGLAIQGEEVDAGGPDLDTWLRTNGLLNDQLPVAGARR